jgi:SAM-dependent methyltransferase
MSHIDSIIDNTLLNYVTDANEVEYRLGYYQGKSFNPNIGVFEFQRLLNSAKNKNNTMTSDIMLTIIATVDNTAHIARIHDDGTGNKVRALCLTDRIDPKSKNVEFYSKVKSDQSFDYNLRLSYGKETPLTSSEITALTDHVFDGRANKGVGTIKTYRYAKRYSFALAEFEGHPVTLSFTIVKQGQGLTFRGSQTLDQVTNPEELYEVELEFLGWNKELFAAQREYVKSQLGNLMTEFAGGPIYVNNTNILDNVRQFVGFCNGFFNMKLSPDKLTDVSPTTLSTISKYFIGAQARSITYGLIEHKKLLRTDPTKPAPYCVSDKADGQRSLFFVNRDGYSFLITDHVGDFYTKLQTNKTNLAQNKIGEKRKWLKFIPTGIKPDSKLVNSLYDGETVIVNGTYFFLAFDCLINNGVKITAQPFWQEGKAHRKQHLDYMTQIFPSTIVSSEFVNVRSKEFHYYILEEPNVFTTEFLANIEVTKQDDILKMLYTSDDKSIAYDLDGIIIQKCDSVYPEPVDGPSKWPDTYKWKPVNHTTIDFKLVPDGTVMGSVIGLDGTYAIFKTGYNHQHQYRDSMQYNPYKCYATITDDFPRTVSGEAIVSGDIVECRFVYGTTSYWEPIRVRRDKMYPNGQAAHDDNMNFISNPITFESLAVAGGMQSSSTTLKNVNKINRAYSNAHIAKYGDDIRETHPVKFKILDLACGKGQSADGWYAAGATHVVGVDIRTDIHMSISPSDKYLKSRANAPQTAYYQSSMIVPLNLSTITSDALARQLENPLQFIMVVCNFAIHYAFASKDNLRNLLYNVTRNLTREGYFVGSYMNGRKVLELIADKTNTVASQVKMERTTNSVSAVTVDKKKTLWKLHVPSISENVVSFGHNLEVSIDALYGQKPSNEYLVDLDNAEVLALFAEYGLSLVEHLPFTDIDISKYKDSFFQKITKETMSPDDKKWYALHCTFAFKKTRDVDYIALLQKSWNVQTVITAETPQGQVISGIVPGKTSATSFKSMNRDKPTIKQPAVARVKVPTIQVIVPAKVPIVPAVAPVKVQVITKKPALPPKPK